MVDDFLNMMTCFYHKMKIYHLLRYLSYYWDYSSFLPYYYLCVVMTVINFIVYRIWVRDKR